MGSPASHPRSAVLLEIALRRIARSGEGAVPSRAALLALRLGWGNLTYSAPTGYLRRAAELAVRGGGPVLECGSGVTTVLLGALGRVNGFRVTALEQDERWRASTRRALDRLGLGGTVDVVYAPIRRYEDFDWYDVERAPLAPRYALVVCDGPPGTTRGGREGLLPVLGDRLDGETVILLDDVHRRQERALVERWGAGASVRWRRSGVLHRFAEIGRDRGLEPRGGAGTLVTGGDP